MARAITHAAIRALPARNRALGAVSTAERVICLAVLLAIGVYAINDARDRSNAATSVQVYAAKTAPRQTFATSAAMTMSSSASLM